MLAVQHRLPLVSVRTRYARRPFHPSQDQGAYRLPHDVRDRLVLSLAPFRNREAAYVLAVFWRGSGPFQDVSQAHSRSIGAPSRIMPASISRKHA